MIDQHIISYYIGIFIIFSSHIYLLVVLNGKGMTGKEVLAHSIINILSGILIAYYFMHKENFIKF